MDKVRIITGNEAAALAAKLCRVQVIAAYPITPQSKIPEILSKFVEEGELKAEFVRVESEHSAMTVCISASLVGARAFTATAANGLAYMHEQLHWAAGARVPVVMPVVNRGLGAPWTIFNDMQDSISQRDTGWMQLYCMNNQEIFDNLIMAYRVAEEVLIPCMVCFDGFRLSHTVMPVETASQELVDAYLPPRKPNYELNPERPVNINPVVMGDCLPGVDGTRRPDYMGFRLRLQRAHERALEVIKKAGSLFGELFGRDYTLPYSTYRVDDADTIFVTMGSLTSEAMDAVDLLRERGHRAGVCGLRVFRPFPGKDLSEVLLQASRLIVVEKAISYGYETPLATELKAALYTHTPDKHPEVTSWVVGLGGKDVKTVDLIGIFEATMKLEQKWDRPFWWHEEVLENELTFC
ncbi:transketolase C-terminal domain-containing protein [Thermodesulforhabdus norvegica]|uniref:Pyruvate ferredoxin oxidoreductase alpha subunit n=1 Tax=Thermodesulforhabdus norvegica TaxID=39841 RepID=A0A1I4QZ92_9BACT|nr:transketolase C-terminal domain-containing protein [Thermodesulforhabdus norvegica]SFM45359.1 pyruvate ferredoxin oxidoreductase alpha subunit [Thermodesulforhabdus norvegica]